MSLTKIVFSNPPSQSHISHESELMEIAILSLEGWIACVQSENS